MVSNPSDSKSFGNALAMSGNYLAVGDPEANRVVLFARDDDGVWSRMREILPPKGSNADKVGSGFGYDLSFDEKFLIVGAYTEKHKPISKEGFQLTNQLGVSFSGGVYLVPLDKAAKVQRIDVLAEREISGLSVSVDKGKIAYGIRRLDSNGRWIGRVRLLSGSNSKDIVAPTDSAAHNFGIDVEIKNHLLLVGAPFDGTGSAWLFNLNAPDSVPQRLAIPDAHIGSTVAISDQFAVVGAVGGLTSPQPPKTLIRAIKDNSTTVIDGAGRLSLDRNILARTRPRSNDGEQEALLELFDLTNFTASRLIERRRGIDRAHLQNSFLTTVQKTGSKTKLCIEPRMK